MNKVQVWVYRRAKSESGEEHLEVLLLHTLATRGGFWQPITGGIDSGEKNEVAALREVEEETGIRSLGDVLDLDYEFEFETRDGRAIERVYALEAPSVSAIRLSSQEHDEYRWCSFGEAEELLKFESNRYGLHLLKRVLTGAS